MFEELKIGGVYQGAQSKSEGCYFDITDSGAIMILNFCDPTQKEIDAVGKPGALEVRFTRIDDILFLVWKFADIPWVETPYNIQYSRLLTKLDVPKEDEGLSILIMLTDKSTGIIKSLRLIGLSTDFTKLLYAEILQDYKNPSPKFKTSGDYTLAFMQIQKKYTTVDIAKRAKYYCKFL